MMNSLARNEHRAVWFAAAYSPLTVSWTEQLLAETEMAVRQAVTEQELASAVWALAKLTYSHIQGFQLGELWFIEEETVAQRLPALLALPGDLTEQLRAFSLAEEEASAGEGKHAGVPATRELRRLAVRLIQYARNTKRGYSNVQ